MTPLTAPAVEAAGRLKAILPDLAPDGERDPSGPTAPEDFMKDGTKRPLPKEQRPWLTVREAADYVAVSPKTIYNAAKQGHLRHVRVGGRAIRTTRGWVNTWLLGEEAGR